MTTKKSAPKKPTPAPKAAPAKASAQPVITIKQLAASISEKHGQTNKHVTEILARLVEGMVSHLKNGDRLRINGLGILEVKHRAARTGRNPATGEPIDIAESRKISFRPSKELKDVVLEG